MVIKIVGISLIGIFCSLIIGKYNKEIALLISIVCGIVIFLIVYDGLKEIIYEFINISNTTYISSIIIESILKAIGIGYLIEFASNVCEDSGNKTLTTFILLAGKILISLLALPIIKILFNSILSLL